MDFAWAKQESPPKDAKNIARMYFVSEAVSKRPTLTTPLVTSTSPVTRLTIRASFYEMSFIICTIIEKTTI